MRAGLWAADNGRLPVERRTGVRLLILFFLF